SAESSEIAETTEIESETACDDETLSDSAVKVNLMTESTGNTCGDNLTWQLSQIDSSVYYSLTISGSGDMYDFSSASSLPWYGQSTMIKNVYIGSEVTSIGSRAFYDFAITSIDIPENITKIGDYAFGSSELQTVTIPSSVNEIGIAPFCSCAKLKSIEVDENNKYYKSSDGVLFDIDMTELIQYPLGKSDSSYDIPNGIKSINNSAFYMEYYTYSSAVKNIYIPASVEAIGNGCFYYCKNLKKITFEDNSCLTNIGHSAFMHCTSLTDISIPSGITDIEKYTFHGCTSMSNIIIPSGVTNIGSNAFGDCSSLKTVTVMNDAATISDDAFNKCTSLENVFCYDGSTADNSSLYNDSTYIAYIANANYWFDSSTGSITGVGVSGGEHLIIPSYIDGVEVTSIKSLEKITMTVSTESTITSIYIPSTVTSITSSGFQYYSVLKYIYVSDFNSNYCSVDGVLFDTDVTDLIVCPRKIALETYEIPETVTDIEEYAFYGNTALTNITVPSGVTSINKNTFRESTSLESLNIQGSIASIGASAFYGCTSLKTFEFSDEITEISASTFYNCTSLEGITIPENVTSIGNYAFYNCSSLTEVIIPDSVISIGSSAFCICSGIKTLVLSNNLTSVGSGAFTGLSSLTSVTIPESLVEPSNSMFSSCTSLTDVTIPNSITSISDQMFSSCKSLTSITIPDSVTEIGLGAFMYCTSLTDITIPNSVTSLGRLSLSYCTSLESVTIPSSVITIGSALFEGCDTDQITLYVEADSYALSYAEENGYNYIIVSNEEARKFEMLKDNYGFKNEPDSFGYTKGQEMSLDIFKKLYGEPLGETMFNKYKKWPGSCFGMAATCLGFFEYNSDRTLYSETFGLDSSNEAYTYMENLYGVPAPSSSSSLNVLTHFIEIFLISQWAGTISSIYNGPNLSYSSNGWRSLDSMINIINNFEETGEDPIVIILYNGNAHAVVPFDVEEDSEGNYVVSLYDNNMPDETTYLTIYKDESGFTGFYYDGNTDGTDDPSYIYTVAISYVYEEDIYNYVADALSANSVSLMENNSSDKLAHLFVNSDDVEITNSSGVSIDDIEEAFKMITIGTPSDTIGYCVPYGEYIIKNKDSSLESFELSVATSVDAKTIVTDDNTAAVTVGIYDTGYTYISASASSKSNIEITMVNSSGQKQVVEADCTYLSVDTEGLYETYVKSSESYVYVNGVSTKVSSSTGTSISTQDVSGSGSIITDIGTVILTGDDYYFAESGNTDLSCTDGKITGNICLNLYNKSGSSFSAVIVAAIYDSEGKFVCSENKSIVVGNDSNYISLKNLSIDVNENEDYSCRVFLWKDMLSMRPITAPVDIEIS
ncbi:MAG: leucine-rich repeat domain-containing protein, partial [Clostridiales bacterium]|nr:leucine-rich repeat domain-containing protein [Clostridiales bacterium]